MTKKDYVLIAQVLCEFAERSPMISESYHANLRLMFINALKKDNPAFMAHKFLRAAQGEE